MKVVLFDLDGSTRVMHTPQHQDEDVQAALTQRGIDKLPEGSSNVRVMDHDAPEVIALQIPTKPTKEERYDRAEKDAVIAALNVLASNVGMTPAQLKAAVVADMRA